MKRRIMLIIGGVVLFLFILFTSFAWFKIFYGKNQKDGEISILNIQFSDYNNTINTTQDAPLTDPDNSINPVEPYTFTITNTSQKDSHYQLILEEDPISNKDGYRQEQLLKRSQLNYQLILENQVIKTNRLSNLKNNILDDRIIRGNQTFQYALKIWIHNDVKTGEWENKYYHYKVKLNVLGE